MKEFIRFTRPMAMSLKFLKLFFTTLFFSLTVCHSNGQEILERHKVHEGKTKSTLNEKEDEQLYRIIKFHWNDDLELSLEIFNQLECMDCPLLLDISSVEASRNRGKITPNLLQQAIVREVSLKKIFFSQAVIVCLKVSTPPGTLVKTMS